MAIALGDAVIRITGDLSGFNTALVAARAEATASFGAIAQSARMMGMAMTAGGVALGAGLISVVKVSAEFEDAIITAAAVTGKTGEAFDSAKEKISELAKHLGGTTVFTARQAANAFVALGRKGIDVSRLSVEQLQPIMDLAVGQNYDLEKSAQVLTQTMKSYGLEFSDVGRIADTFTVATTSSDATIQKLSHSMPIVAATAKAAGIPLEELVAVLATLNDRGIDASTSGTGLRRVISSLLNPTKAMIERLDLLGLTEADISFESKTLTEIMRTLGDAGFDVSDSFRGFGQRAAVAVEVLKDSNKAVEAFTQKIKDADEPTRKLAAERMKSLNKQWTLFTSAIEAIALELGESLIPNIKSLLEVLTPMLQGIKRWLAENPKLTKGIAHVVGVVAVLVTGLGALMSVVGFLAIPVLALVTLLGGGAATGSGAGLAGAAKAAGAGIGVAAAASGKWRRLLGKGIKGPGGALIGAVLWLADSIWLVVDAHKQLNGMQKKINDTQLSGIKQSHKAVDIMREMGIRFNDYTHILMTGASGQEATLAVLRTALHRQEQGLKNIGVQAKISFQKAAQDAVIFTENQRVQTQKITGFWASVRRAIMDVIIQAAQGGTQVPNIGGGFEAQQEQFWGPAFAGGTISAQGGPAIVGERGPEILNIKKGSQVTPSAQSRGMMGNTANFNAPLINIQSMSASNEGDVNALNRMLGDVIKRTMNAQGFQTGQLA